MTKIDRFILLIQLKIAGAIKDFLTDENGDTNFVAMIIIIGIVIALAALFLAFGKEIMETVSTRVKEWLEKILPK